MSAKYYRPGMTVPHTPDGADVEAGSFVAAVCGIGDGVGFADGSGILDGVAGELLCGGVVAVDNPDNTAFAAGAQVGWDATNKKAVATTTGDTDIGVAWVAYVADSLVVYVAINGQIGSV